MQPLSVFIDQESFQINTPVPWSRLLMNEQENSITILVAEDNEIDRLMAREALKEVESCDDLRFVEDGEELMDYLRHCGKYDGRIKDSPRPKLILLDLMLPRKSGFEAIQEIKADPELRQIPIMVMTASKAQEDKLKAYAIDAECFITKPDSFKALVTLMNALRWWTDQD